jgi:hypothetical protein
MICLIIASQISFGVSVPAIKLFLLYDHNTVTAQIQSANTTVRVPVLDTSSSI